jgi:hypothetical protein
VHHGARKLLTVDNQVTPPPPAPVAGPPIGPLPTPSALPPPSAAPPPPPRAVWCDHEAIAISVCYQLFACWWFRSSSSSHTAVLINLLRLREREVYQVLIEFNYCFNRMIQCSRTAGYSLMYYAAVYLANCLLVPPFQIIIQLTFWPQVRSLVLLIFFTNIVKFKYFLKNFY